MKKVLITGGNGDIAQAIAKELSQLEQYEVQTPGKEQLDVTNIKNVETYMENYVPDILINNAGYVVPMSIGSGDIYSEKKSIDINLFGTFNCTAAVLSQNPDAQIINIGSSAATKVHGTWSSYCASKAAVVMATRCWADDGYYVVCISPGRAATKMRKQLFSNEDQSTLLKPKDFAKVIIRAINGAYKSGSHIDVTIQNVEEILNG